MKLVGLLLSGLLIVGCAQAPKVYTMRPFDEAEFKPYAGGGTSKITGQAFLLTQGGDRKFGAGQTVYLIPATPYNREVCQATYAGFAVQADPSRARYERSTTADGDGRFEFERIPAGTYYLECQIFWSYAAGRYSQSTGGVAKGTVKVVPGETVNVIMHDVTWSPDP